MCFEKININNLNKDNAIENNIPLSEDQIVDIYNYMKRNGELSSIYDLLNVNSISSEDIHILKYFFYVDTNKEKDLVNKYYYKVDYWLPSDEGSDGINDLRLNNYYNKKNINNMTYDDLLALPNVSPIDAYEIIKVQNKDYIEYFQFKNIPASYYGKKNLKDFIVFEDAESKKVNIRYNLMTSDLRSTSGMDENDIPLTFDFKNTPETLSKVFIGTGKTNIGLLRYNNLGDPYDVYTKKMFVSFENINLSNKNKWLKIDKMILGNFKASYGLGVIFDSRDSWIRKNTGMGFSKVEKGISYDLTRSSQYVLDGYAAQISNRKVRLSMFYSNGFINNNNKRDAIINEDGSFSSLISMRPRLPYGILNGQNAYGPKIHESLINSVEEKTLGGNLRVFIDDSFSIEFTAYESMYDRVLDPQIINTITGGEDDLYPGYFDENGGEADYDVYSGDAFFTNGYVSNAADPEVRAMYSNSGYSDIWSGAKSYRRVFGGGFSKVLGKMSIQGEYGQLDLKDKNDPKAFVVNTYMRFDTFNLLVLYRDYDLDFDNPYQRSFSQYKRYKSTILEDHFWLEDPYYSHLHISNPQPQAEKGYYVESRFVFLRSLVADVSWDSWIRKADNAQYYKIVTNLQWKPLFNYIIKFRYTMQSRGSLNIFHPSMYYIKGGRVTFKINLSNFDKIEFLYSWNYLNGIANSRLHSPPDFSSPDLIQGSVGSPDTGLGFSYEHNFNQFVDVGGGVLYVGGYLWFVEGDDFRMFDTTKGLVHSWLSFSVRPNDFYIINFKVSHSSDSPYTTIPYGTSSQGQIINNPYIYDENFNYKIQINYAL